MDFYLGHLVLRNNIVFFCRGWGSTICFVYVSGLKIKHNILRKEPTKKAIFLYIDWP